MQRLALLRFACRIWFACRMIPKERIRHSTPESTRKRSTAKASRIHRMNAHVPSRLGPSVVPFYPYLGEGSPTNLDYRRKGTPILPSLLEGPDEQASCALLAAFSSQVESKATTSHLKHDSMTHLSPPFFWLNHGSANQ